MKAKRLTVLLFVGLLLHPTISLAQMPDLSVQMEEIDKRLSKLEDAQDDLLLRISGPVLAAILSAFVSYGIFVWNAGRKERRQRAVDLLKDFMTSDSYIKARLVIQQYLLPTGAKYAMSLDSSGNLLNFAQLTTALESSEEDADQEARFYIRAIPSFFWLVDQAKNAKYIKSDEFLFTPHYTWYWVHIIRFRLKGCEDHRLFQKIEWLLSNKDEIQKCEKEYHLLIDTLPPDQKKKWNNASTAAIQSVK
jgi:hypothetical protein